ncbi:MAG: histidine triad nucleotide-binding protein [Actinobacteria bacterium]|nr:histidine triad nucleotide-binding protein [Actinomycetota bacterium]
MADDCLFCSIIAGDQPADLVAEDDAVVAFHDKYPRAPVHVLVVTREHLPSADDLSASDADVLWDCFDLAQRVAAEQGIADGYRIVTNIGPEGGQAIPHLHFHVLGGKQLGHVDGT